MVSSIFQELSPFQFWLLWFLILCATPLILYYFIGNEWVLPGFFIFAGFWFTYQSMQVYAQLLAMLVFAVLVFSKPSNNKMAAIVVLLFLDFFYILVIQNEFKYILGAAFFIELFFLINNKNGALFAFWFVSDIVTKIKQNVYGYVPGWRNAFYYLIYYGYTFLVEYMLVIFTVPGIRELWRSKNRRHLMYFLLIIGGALYFWIYEQFYIWRVTRVLLFFPIITLPYFIIWLEKQTKRRKIIFWIIGIIYFCFNLAYFVLKQ